MNININDYKTAQRIFYNLLKTGELKEKSNKELFLAYMNDDNVRKALDCISEESKVRIKSTGDTIYLIPEIDNDILGFNVNNSKDKFLLGETYKDIYLSYLIMTVIFAEFTNELLPATYIEVPNILDLVSESLERTVLKENIEILEQQSSFNIKQTKELWDSKLKWDEHDKMGIKSTSLRTQIGCIRKIITFLQKQNLINTIDGEDKIVPTSRFNDLMGFFKEEERKKEIEELLTLKGENINA